jgi:hypothetical protein
VSIITKVPTIGYSTTLFSNKKYGIDKVEVENVLKTKEYQKKKYFGIKGSSDTPLQYIYFLKSIQQNIYISNGYGINLFDSFLFFTMFGDIFQ